MAMRRSVEFTMMIAEAQRKAEAMGIDPEKVTQRAVREAATDPLHGVSWWLDEMLRRAAKEPSEWRA